MPSLLILNHHGGSVPALLESVRETGASFKVIEPPQVTRTSARGFDGVIASGGFLSSATYKKDLETYSALLDELEQPFLGVCLGLKILGHYYAARMRRITPSVGMHAIRFLREYRLGPGIRECMVYQAHRYELLNPLPDVLENYATGDSPVQAVKVKGIDRYGLQFHPELSEEPALGIVRNFVSLCRGAAPQGT